MSKSIYLINPAADLPTFFGAEIFAAQGFTPAVKVAPLVIPTIASMVPDDFELRICDELVEPIDFDVDVDFVAITCMVSQQGRMRSIARRFRERGITVIIGGALASLNPEAVRPHCDILFRGELEPLASSFFDDLRTGQWQPEYFGDKADLSTSPIPRWDIYPNERALFGTLQTSRGCPFECEFCDVIQYLGRKQRHKEVAQIIQELEVLYAHGYREVYLADDNFTVYRSRAKKLLSAFIDWQNSKGDDRVRFSTQISIDAARDPELLVMCHDAGLVNIFIGIETPNEASLKEANKQSNLRFDLKQQIETIAAHGLCIQGGMIVGFDADDQSIFQRQFEFAMSVPIPFFSLGVLVAPFATLLYERLSREGRIIEDEQEIAGAWNTNIIPAQMSREELTTGFRRLFKSLYSPRAFGDRLALWLEQSPETVEYIADDLTKLRPVELEMVDIATAVEQLGEEEAALVSRVKKWIVMRPADTADLLHNLFLYAQVRHVMHCEERCEVMNPRDNYVVA